jgi:hypothetical protein
MRANRWRIGLLVVLGTVALAVRPAKGDDRPTNTLEGVVTFKEDGRPAAYVPVVLVHHTSGYIYIQEDGLNAGGERETVLQYFAKPNSRHFGQVLTDSAGRFTLTGLAAPDQRWIVAAGDPQSGYVLRADVRPQDYATAPLKLELEKPAFLNVKLPRPPAKSLRISLSVGLAETAPAAQTESGTAEEATSADAERVYISIPYPLPVSRDKPVRVGPLPGGQAYKVTASAYSSKLSYQPTILERVVTPAAGASLDVTLESTEAGVVTGTITGRDEKPLSAVNVMVKTADGLVVGALTDEAGKYELHGVPGGTHKLELLRHAKRMVPG